MKKENFHLLVPTAGRPHCESAVRFGARLVRQYDGQLTLMTVVRRKSLSEQGEMILQKAISQAQAEGVTAKTILRFGQPARKIVTESKSQGAAMIVMGSRPWHKRLRKLLGSTSQAVLIQAAVPVLIARGDPQPPTRMLLCDSGAVSPRLVERTMQTLPLLLHKQVQVTVLHVMSQIGAGPGVKSWELRADANELVKAHTPEGELLAGDARLLQKNDIQTVVKIRHGLVVEEIMLEAMDGDYDLVVIGAHQHGGWQDLLLDDLQQQIIACLDRPVLVIK